MTPLLLTDIERAVRRSWSADTSPPTLRSRWSPDNPARGQCGVTAMVLDDLLGGELIRGEVQVDGRFRDYHWWNRIGQDVEPDLTREHPPQPCAEGARSASPIANEPSRPLSAVHLICFWYRR
ncbi:hypothetical protein [Streptomyces sp. NPDC017988]|uniref:YunG family protein n=1 Tax=Streptomyces sp. NPDC017988 TaxID=3365025 RepID=UPI0037A340D3